MTSLVAADYGSSDSDGSANDDESQESSSFVSRTGEPKSSYFVNDEENESDDENSSGEDVNKNEQNESKEVKPTLPSASGLFSNGNQTGQVFNNPYKVAENAKIASLEKHVKMVDVDVKTKMKNGKKICWNYRKGRCRFGSNCTYAHDSDLHVEDSNETANNERNKTVNRNNEKPITRKTNRRPGLGDSVVPSKKVMRNYYNTSNK